MRGGPALAGSPGKKTKEERNSSSMVHRGTKIRKQTHFVPTRRDESSILRIGPGDREAASGCPSIFPLGRSVFAAVLAMGSPGRLFIPCFLKYRHPSESQSWRGMPPVSATIWDPRAERGSGPTGTAMSAFPKRWAPVQDSSIPGPMSLYCCTGRRSPSPALRRRRGRRRDSHPLPCRSGEGCGSRW